MAAVAPAAADDSLELTEIEEEIVQSQLIVNVASHHDAEHVDIDGAAGNTFNTLKTALVNASIAEEDAEMLIATSLSRTAAAIEEGGASRTAREHDW